MRQREWSMEVMLVCDGVRIEYWAMRDDLNISLVDERLLGVSEYGVELWRYAPGTENPDRRVWMGPSVGKTLDDKFLILELSNYRRIKMNPHSGEVVEEVIAIK